MNGAGKIFHKTGLSLIYKNSLNLIDLKKGDSLLDIGCGNGKILHELESAQGGLKLFGIDPEPEKIGAAKSYNANSPNKFSDENLNGQTNSQISFKIAYASDLPYTNSSMDWIISTLSFHHMPNEEKGKAIGEIARVLKQGGKLLITDFGRPAGFFGTIFAWLSRSHAYTKDNMTLVEQFLLQNNFRILKTTRTWGWIENVLAERKT